MNTVRLHVTLDTDGVLVLSGLPFHAGDELDILLASAPAAVPADGDNALRGTVLRYDDPFGPACPPEEWDAVRCKIVAYPHVQTL